ncbi:MAG: hypothetical protein JXR37_27275 [Kiritimatiellae bacterium]|nr:hypothetical protein [Kiritimatiellia bacterium]
MPPLRNRPLGTVLILVGVIGVMTGLVPLATNGLRVVANDTLWAVADLSQHGVEAMGLSVEWGMLSSAMGTFLGVLLLWAGFAWHRGRGSARLISWIYVLGGLFVNVTDMLIFAFRAKPGWMRDHMLVFDGIALLIPVLLGAWLWKSRPGPHASLSYSSSRSVFGERR